ncbi:hypothetical protein CRYO30217_02227 [Parvicella tangerina]|uniref:DoxX family protein n=2 Tax=Parvicella tangerina TaxID=2829795 RepID=A0A916JNT0_9FLAO|nr:hypothetical protein CRYO30217_02227 [Parvicella tangerina]
MGVFSFLFTLSFSFPFTIFFDVGGLFEPFCNQLVSLEAHLLGIEVASYHSGEDASGLYLNTVNVLFISLLVYWLLRRFLSQVQREKWMVFATVGMRYYLALILLIYGFDKVYKWQFYAPESNILYTRVKDLPQDMLYWTTMGTSYAYSLFAGLIEVLAGLFLLFRKSKVFGLLLSVGVLANVFAVNIGFDITVKLFSGFLLLLSLTLLFPYLSVCYAFFTGEEARLDLSVPDYARSTYYRVSKVVILILFLLETQFKYFVSRNFNDDLAPRAHFNGAYQVLKGEGGIVRVHFHRGGYLIFETPEGEFIDYKMTLNRQEQRIQLIDYDLQEHILEFIEYGDTLLLKDQKGSFSITSVKQKL